MKTKFEKICGTCEWWYKDKEIVNCDNKDISISNGWYCSNPDSKNCTNWAAFKDTCEHWEMRSIEWIKRLYN